MTDNGRARELRERILDLVRQYHEAAFDGAREFHPGDRIPYAGRVFDDAEMVNLVDSSLDFWLTYGRYSEEFERKFADYLGVRWSFLVNSGSSANLLSIAALTSDRLGERRLSPGDEVITVAAGFPTTVAPILQMGAAPVFVDVRADTANVDVERLGDALSSKTKAVVLAHTLGNPFEVRAVVDFCRQHGLWLIEDNCDALGSEYDGKLTGTFGDISTSSFYPPHHMTMGEGGAVSTSDPTLRRILLSMRDWGRDCWCPSGVDNTCGRRFEGQYGTLPKGYDHKYVYSEFGYNLKATDMQAAIGVAQLDKVPGFVEARRRNFETLRALLAPLAGTLDVTTATPGSRPSWFGCLLTLAEDARVSRTELVRELEAAGVQTRMLFAGNMLRQPAFDRMREESRGYRVVGELTNTDRIMRDSFWVGVYPGLTEPQIAYIAEVIRRAAA